MTLFKRVCMCISVCVCVRVCERARSRIFVKKNVRTRVYKYNTGVRRDLKHGRAETLPKRKEESEK